MTSNDGRILVLGGLNFDFVFRASRLPVAGETIAGDAFQTTRGGKAGNQAVAAARMLDGVDRVAMVGRVGGDWMGRAMLDGLVESGIDATRVATDPESTTGVAAIYVDAAGENTVTAVYGANRNVGELELARLADALPGAAVLLVQLETPWPTTQRAIEAARRANVIVVLDPAPAIDLPIDAFAGVDILTPNQGEAERWTGLSVTEPHSAALAGRRFVEAGVGTVLITLGGAGIVAVDAESSQHYPAFSVSPISTLAAGDAFNGALAAVLAGGRDLRQSIERAQAVAALSTTRAGAQESMPSRAEVEAFLV